MEKAKDANIVGILVGTLGVGMFNLEIHSYIMLDIFVPYLKLGHTSFHR